MIRQIHPTLPPPNHFPASKFLKYTLYFNKSVTSKIIVKCLAAETSLYSMCYCPLDAVDSKEDKTDEPDFHEEIQRTSGQ